MRTYNWPAPTETDCGIKEPTHVDGSPRLCGTTSSGSTGKIWPLRVEGKNYKLYDKEIRSYAICSATSISASQGTTHWPNDASY